jgi:hypothetical protein
MPARDGRQEFAPVIIAAIIAAIGGLGLWSELRDDLRDRGDGAITSEAVSRAGAIMAPSELPPRLVLR